MTSVSLPDTSRHRKNHVRLKALLRQRDEIKTRVALVDSLKSRAAGESGQSDHDIGARICSAARLESWRPVCENELVNTQLVQLVDTVIARFVVPWYDELSPGTDDFLVNVHCALCQVIRDFVSRTGDFCADVDAIFVLVGRVSVVVAQFWYSFVNKGPYHHTRLVSDHWRTYRGRLAGKQDAEQVVAQYLEQVHCACEDPESYYTQMAALILHLADPDACISPISQQLASVLLGQAVICRIWREASRPNLFLQVIAAIADSISERQVTSTGTKQEYRLQIIWRAYQWAKQPVAKSALSILDSPVWLLLETILQWTSHRPIFAGFLRAGSHFVSKVPWIQQRCNDLAVASLNSILSTMTPELMSENVRQVRLLIDESLLQNETTVISLSEAAKKVSKAYFSIVESIPWILKPCFAQNESRVYQKTLLVLASFHMDSSCKVSENDPVAHSPLNELLVAQILDVIVGSIYPELERFSNEISSDYQ